MTKAEEALEEKFLQGVLDFYQSRTATKMNVAMERLALITVVLLPVMATIVWARRQGWW